VPRTHQVHFRVTDTEYRFLRDKALSNEEAVASVLRGLVRAAMRVAGTADNKLGTGPVPQALRSSVMASKT
jgi:hypothetical protein